MNRTDEILKKVADNFIKKIEAFDGKWERPFFKYDLDFPKNIVSKKEYRGINTAILWMTAEENDFTSNVWGTFDQWKALKKSIKKGAKGTQVIFFKPTKYTVEVINDTGDTELEEHQSLICRYYTVFNESQIEGYEPKQISEVTIDEMEEINKHREFLNKTGIEYEEGHNRACYIPSIDKVHLPSPEQFIDKAAYIPVSCHEFIHATGSKKRLDRDFTGKFGDESYAFEELVADIGAGFLSAALGKQYIFQNNNIAYLKSWVKVLKDQPKAILKACSHAQKAADYLLGLAEANTKVTDVIGE